jgi:type VI secretion system protein ImpH
MASTNRGQGAGLGARLRERGYEFEFFQALALLEKFGLSRGRVPLGFGSEPEAEPVRLSSPISLRFPATDIAKIDVDEATGGEQPVVHANVMTLAGHGGPLPDWVTELLSLRLSRRDRGSRDFLDIFNHRLLSLLYRVRARARVAFGFVRPDRTPAARYLYSLMGLGTPRLLNRMGVSDRVLLHYAGLMAGRARSSGALEQLLSRCLDSPIRVEPLHGRWLDLHRDDWTTIGRGGRNNGLGTTAIVGRRVWDVESCFVLSVGPLSYRDHLTFLPGGSRHAPFIAMTRFFVGETLDFVIKLTIKRSEIPTLKLGAKTGARLGWTSFLRTQEQTAAIGEIKVRPRWPKAKPGDAS